MKSKALILFILLQLVFSCNSVDQRQTQLCPIDIQKAELISLNDLLASADLVSLELTAESVLPPGGRMWPANGCILYSGRVSGAEQVFQFSEDGTYVRRIGKPGAGPGEYISCYNLVDLGDTLAIYDQSKKFSFYLKESGQFVGDINLSGRMINAASIHPQNRDVYLLTGSRNYQIYRLDRSSLREKDSFLQSTVRYESMNNSFYPIQSGKLIFQNRDDRSLIFFEIDEHLKVKYQLLTDTDLSEYQLEDDRTLQKIRSSGQKIWMVRGFLENEDWIYLYLRYDVWSPDRDYDMMHYLYHKSSKKAFFLPGRRANMDLFGPGFRLDSANCLYLSYTPEQMEGNVFWQKRLNELGLKFDLFQNPYVVILALDGLGLN